MRIARLILGVTVSVALVTTALPAWAEPDVPDETTQVAPAPTARWKDVRDMPNNYKAKIKWANYLRKKAVTRSALTGQSTLNYAKSTKYDKGKTKDRRKFVAGFQMAGGHVTRISKKSQKAVNAHKIPNEVVYKELPKNPFGVPYCQGSNKMVKYKNSNYNYRWYRDSCKTALIIAVLGSVTVAAGVVTVAVPPAASFTATITAICAIGTVAVYYMRDTSKLNAVFIRMRYPLVWVGRQS